MTVTAAIRARQLLALRRADEAVAAASDGLRDDPDDVELLRLLALAQCDSGHPADAIATARRAAGLRPDDTESFRILGVALYSSGDHSGAIEQFERALERSPDDIDVHVRISEALLKEAHRRGRRPRDTRVQKAEQHARHVVRGRPARPEGNLLLAKVAMARRDLNGAETHARRALEQDPNSVVARQLLGIVAQGRGDVSGAAQHYVEAGRIDPRSRGSMQLLRGLKVASPLGVIAMLVVLRLLIGIGGATAGAAGAIVLVAAAVVTFVAVQRQRTRRQLPDDARQVLDRDRAARPSRLRRGR